MTSNYGAQIHSIRTYLLLWNCRATFSIKSILEVYHTRCLQKAKSVILEPIKGMVKWIAKHEHHKFISIYLFHNLNYCNNSNSVLQSIQFLACTDSQFWHNNLIYLLFPYESEEKDLRYKTITIKSALTLTIFLLFRPPPELYHILGPLRSIWKALEFKNCRVNY